MRHYPIVFVVAVLLAFACKGGKTGEAVTAAADSAAEAVDSVPADTLEQLIAELPMPIAADELFDDFIFNFVANRKLQTERIVFPLRVTKSSGQQEQLKQRQWRMEHFFMRQGYYTLIFDNASQMELMKDTSVRHAVVEKIFLRQNMVRQYVFHRIRGRWMMTNIQEVALAQHPNASFLDFYAQFAADPAFQLSSLNGTVQFVGPDPDDDFSQMEGVITPDTWPAFAPELPSEMIYNIVYGEPVPSDTQKIFMLRGIANGEELEMVFRRQSGRWRLVKLTT